MNKKIYSFLYSFCLYIKTSIVKLLVVIVICLSPYKILAQSIKENNTELPTPTGNPNQLFYLQRTKNTNTIIYELNKKNGALDLKNPIHIYWIMYTSHKEHQQLSTIEKKYAYGITIIDKGNEEYQFTLVAYPKINLYLKKGSDQNYHVYLTLSGKLMILQRTFIKEKEGSFSLSPSIEYIDFFGINVESGKEMNERIWM
jgi:hypothetical protein